MKILNMNMVTNKKEIFIQIMNFINSFHFYVDQKEKTI